VAPRSWYPLVMANSSFQWRIFRSAATLTLVEVILPHLLVPGDKVYEVESKKTKNYKKVR
jgi:hypothetical protein